MKLIDGIGSTEMLHVFVSAADDDIVPGATGRAVPGYRADRPGRDGHAGAARHARPAGGQGPDRLPLPGRPPAGGLRAARLERHRRHVRPGRARLLLLPGPRRRHDRLVRLQHRRARGRGGAARPPGGRRVVRRRRARRRPAASWSRPTSCCPPGVDGGDALVAELQAFAKARIAPVQVPAGRSSSSTTLPRTSTGKIQRFVLRARAAEAAGVAVRIAVIGGGPGGLYFAALTKQLDPAHEIVVWERNAADDTFGFGVVFSDETLGGIEHADEWIFARMEREFARWDDIDVHYRDEVLTSGGHGFAAMSRRRLLQILQERCADLGVDVRFSTPAPDVDELARDYDLVIACDGVNSAVRSRYAETFRPVAGGAAVQVHVAGHRQGLRRVQVLRLRDAARHHADPRLPVRRARQHVHRRDEPGRVGAGRLRRVRRRRPRAGRVGREVGRDRARAVRRHPRRPPGHDEQLQVGQLHDRAQRALAARQRRAARRRRAHRALLDRLGHEAGDGGRAGAGRVPAGARRRRRRAGRRTRPSGARSCCRRSARPRPASSGSRTSASTPARTRCSSRSTS